MKIIKNGSTRHIERERERERRRAAKEAKERKAAEKIYFHCNNCGCKFYANRGEYYIIRSLAFGLGEKPVSVVARECPYCSEYIEAVSDVRLYPKRNELLDCSRWLKERGKLLDI